MGITVDWYCSMSLTGVFFGGGRGSSPADPLAPSPTTPWVRGTTPQPPTPPSLISLVAHLNRPNALYWHRSEAWGGPSGGSLRVPRSPSPFSRQQRRPDHPAGSIYPVRSPTSAPSVAGHPQPLLSSSPVLKRTFGPNAVSEGRPLRCITQYVDRSDACFKVDRSRSRLHPRRILFRP